MYQPRTLSRAFSGFPWSRIFVDDKIPPGRPCNAPRGQCWHCDVTRNGTSVWIGHNGLTYSDVFMVTVEEATVKKPSSTEKQPMEGVSLEADAILGAYERIAEYLLCSKYEDGSARETSQLTIGIYEGTVRVSLNDRELKQSIYTQGDSVSECLDMMNAALRHDAVRWYKWNRGKKVK